MMICPRPVHGGDPDRSVLEAAGGAGGETGQGNQQTEKGDKEAGLLSTPFLPHWRGGDGCGRRRRSRAGGGNSG